MSLLPRASNFANDVKSVGYKSIYSFGQNGKIGDGATPQGDLIAIGSELFGTTRYGGKTDALCRIGCGTVFAVTEAGFERVVYRFKGGSDGAGPAGGLIELNGELFGTTSGGGTAGACAYGCGTVFKLTTDGNSQKVLHAFTGGSDGAQPVTGLTAAGGALFGTTQFGGITTKLCPAGCGTVFKISSRGAESVVYRFKGGKDGAQPVARLIAVKSKLYGTTEFGGAATAFCAKGCGTLFQLGTGGMKTIIHSFQYGMHSEDGAYPVAAPTIIDGDLYGTTVIGGEMGDGTVFKANTSSRAEKVVHSFSCCQKEKDGEYPFARLRDVSKLFYGTTSKGGTVFRGTVFRIASLGSERVLHNFTGPPDGNEPEAGLFLLHGKLYGTTAMGGKRSEGTVFALTP